LGSNNPAVIFESPITVNAVPETVKADPTGVGDAFAHQNTARARTELILFIRPTVVKDAVDAHVIAEEMRSKMNNRLVGTSNPVVVLPAPQVPR